MTQESGKIFLLGLGGHRCGSARLRVYLRAHSEVDLGLVPEYHTFSTAWLPLGGLNKFRFAQKLTHLEESARGKPADSQAQRARARLQLQLRFCDDMDAYFSYFSALADDDRIRLVGDITPRYCALPSHRLAEIRAALMERRFRIRVVFMMRDPIERIWSHIRHAFHGKIGDDAYAKTAELVGVLGGEMPPAEGAPSGALSDDALFLALYRSAAMQSLTRYEHIAAQIQSAFSPHEIFFGLYEQAFEPKNRAALMAFLGLTALPFDSDRRPHHRPKNQHLAPASVRAARAFYDEAYRFAAGMFSEQKVAHLWPHYHYQDA